MSAVRVRAFGRSDRGRVRASNEDSWFAGTTVFAVADGMGGHQAGEVASDMALDPVRAVDGQRFDTLEEGVETLRQAFTRANDDVMDRASSDVSLRGMGTTLTAVILHDGRLAVAHVGDSRAYLVRAGAGMRQLTTDHTLVEQLVQEGRLSRDEVSTHPQRSVITRAIGVDRAVDVDAVAPVVLEPGDQVLLCSDGLTTPLRDEQIVEILERHDDGDEACEALIAAANAAGGPDNITVLLLRVEPAGGPDAHTAAVRTAGTSAASERDGDATQPQPRADVRIRTREERAQGWDAHRMGQIGATQGVRQIPAHPRSRRRLALVVVPVIVVVAALALGWFALSRAWFVGVDDGQVAIFQGIPDEILGVPLHRVSDRSDVRVDELPALRRERLRAGIAVGSQGEARRLIAAYERERDEQRLSDDVRRTPSPTPLPRPSPPPTARATPGTPTGTPAGTP